MFTLHLVFISPRLIQSYFSALSLASMIMQTFTFNDGSLKKKKNNKVHAFYLEKINRTLFFFFFPPKRHQTQRYSIGESLFFFCNKERDIQRTNIDNSQEAALPGYVFSLLQQLKIV